MDRISVPPTATEHEAAHAALLDAARDTLEWLRSFQRHAPQEVRFGGEEKVTRRLSAAVRKCSFEIRGCDGGAVPGPTAHPMERPKPEPCPSCGGARSVRVFSYGRPRGRR